MAVHIPMLQGPSVRLAPHPIPHPHDSDARLGAVLSQAGQKLYQVALKAQEEADQDESRHQVNQLRGEIAAQEKALKMRKGKDFLEYLPAFKATVSTLCEQHERH